MYADRCHHGPVQVNSFNDAVKEKGHYMVLIEAGIITRNVEVDLRAIYASSLI